MDAQLAVCPTWSFAPSLPPSFLPSAPTACLSEFRMWAKSYLLALLPTSLSRSLLLPASTLQ